VVMLILLLRLAVLVLAMALTLALRIVFPGAFSWHLYLSVSWRVQSVALVVVALLGPVVVVGGVRTVRRGAGLLLVQEICFEGVADSACDVHVVHLNVEELLRRGDGGAHSVGAIEVHESVARLERVAEDLRGGEVGIDEMR
jgi:hypothetical protein